MNILLKNGLDKIAPHRTDYSLLHTYGAVAPDTEGLPDNFSIYDGRAIPNQNDLDTRFTPALPPLPYGCTGETGTFDSGLQDGDLYNPEDLYLNTPPGGAGGRDIREALKALCERGPRKSDGTFGPKRLAYFNCYGAGKIDDFNAARIALWINQWERRGVWIGTYWYWGAADGNGILSVPSFNIREATLHCYLVTGWVKRGEEFYLEAIPWVGESFGDKGKIYISHAIYNALMQQPWTGAFTTTKQPSTTPIPIGYQAIIDHLIYLIRNLFRL